ncbi:unnamed protein product [Periconia digitata]|uniref:Uncharacterized protein n=1 Tax=Periconia digitata TaxID=1303443 RepID=A0A9W4UDU2_9PLEO|nr:unnamed protein product [Periconia digitata]
MVTYPDLHSSHIVPSILCWHPVQRVSLIRENPPVDLYNDLTIPLGLHKFLGSVYVEHGIRASIKVSSNRAEILLAL